MDTQTRSHHGPVGATHRLAILAIGMLLVGCSAAPSQSPGPAGTAGPDATSGAEVSSAPDATLDPNISFDPGAAFDPVALAEDVVNAGTDAEREGAVLAALASIGLGVYTAEGDPIVPGAERTSTDFMVYDFEVIALAGGIADGDDVFLDDVAAELSATNVAAGGSAIEPRAFAAEITSATADAMANPDDEAGYALRLARELGVRRATPVDLAAPPGDAPIVLDPLAAFLVAADVALPRILGAEPAPVTAVSTDTGIRLAAVRTAADPCAKFRRQVGRNWHAGASTLAGNSANNASFSRSLQARLIGGTVKVGGSFDREWHHRHPDDQISNRHYQVGLQVRVQVPRRINCGPIRFANGQMQGGGQVVGAPVTWTHPGLDEHGDITCDAACQTTDSSGVATLGVLPFPEPPPGGIGPEFQETVPVMAEINLFQALGPQLLGVLSLPPDMRIFARKTMPSDIKWHRAFKIHVVVDSTLHVSKAQAFEYANHVGTGSARGVVEAATLHAPGELAYLPPTVGKLDTITHEGTGPKCAPGAHGAEGSIIADNKSGSIDFLVVDAVVYPPEKTSLYLDVGPADDSHDDNYRIRQCAGNKVVTTTASPSVNLWEGTIFRSYPRGMRFEGTGSGAWQVKAAPQDWAGDQGFEVATWKSSEACAGYCDTAKSSLELTIVADPLPDP